jgi:hypothetical protein
VVNSIRRKKSVSGRTSYRDPIVIHQSSKTRVKVLSHFIQRSEKEDELSLKVIKEETSRNGHLPPLFQEKCFITLNHSATLKLYQYLKQNLEIAKQGSDGEYIVMKIEDGANNLASFDKETVTNTLLKVLSEKDIVDYLSSREVSNEIRNSLRIAMKTNEMREAIQELKSYLNDGEAREQIYQEWCEKYSWVFGSNYLTIDQVRSISPSDNIDLLLPTVFSGFRDIIELKRPNMEVLNYDSSHRNYYFSSEVSKAIGQCKRYIRVFRELAKNGLRDNEEIITCEPKAIIIIGRSSEWKDDKVQALHELSSELHNISIITYDELLARGERQLEIVCEEDKSVPEEIDDEDGLPF